MAEITREDLAYAAGIIDGEGCIIIAKLNYPKRGWPTNYELHVRVGTADRTISPWLHKKFGGSLCIAKSRYKNRCYHIWSMSAASAENFLRMILPWLKLKRKEALVAFRFRRTYKDSGKRSGRICKLLLDSIRKRRAVCYQKIRDLKQEARAWQPQ